MKLTPEQIEQNVEAYRAWQRGEQIERQEYRDGPWLEFASQNGLFKNDLLRIKSQPKLRAWKPEEVPVGALFRWPASMQTLRVGFLITEVDEYTIYFGSKYESPLSEIVKGEHSTDGGETWHPCGVVE